MRPLFSHHDRLYALQIAAPDLSTPSRHPSLSLSNIFFPLSISREIQERIADLFETIFKEKTDVNGAENRERRDGVQGRTREHHALRQVRRGGEFRRE